MQSKPFQVVSWKKKILHSEELLFVSLGNCRFANTGLLRDCWEQHQYPPTWIHIEGASLPHIKYNFD